MHINPAQLFGFRGYSIKLLWLLVNPISIGLLLHPICTGGGGKFTPYLKTDW